MSKLDELKIIDSTEYKTWIKELKNRYRRAQIKASVAVNAELLEYYFQLGEDIEKKSFANKYGSSFFDKLSEDLKIELQESHGFSPVNLRYAHRFYLLYNPILQQLVEDSDKKGFVDSLKNVPWGHHQRIMDKCKGDSNKAAFYVRKTIENHWSRNVLLNFLDTDLYEREGKAVTKESSREPLAISEYELSKLYPKDFKSSMPTIDEIESGIQALLENNLGADK